MGQYLDFHRLLEAAIEEAKMGLAEGGLPIGAALFTDKGKLIGRGHNHRVQNGDPSAHAEIEAFRNAGRRKDYRHTILVTTLAPCWLCGGLIKQFSIGTVIVGESKNFTGCLAWLKEEGVNVVELNSRECVRMLRDYILAYPEVWEEDIGEG